jgi:esterase/lipase superfamily enzyme
MRFRLWIYLTLIVACSTWTGREFSFAQLSATNYQNVKQSLLTLIEELDAKFDRQVAGDQAAFVPQGPINPGLKALGHPVEVWLSDPVAAQGLLNFSSRVFHENGTSDWNLSTLDDGQIAAYNYVISDMGPTRAPVHSTESDGQRIRTRAIFNGPSLYSLNHVGDRDSTLTNVTALWHPPAVQLNQTAPGPTNTAALLPPSVDPRVVEFLFASTRKEIVRPPGQNVSYSGERARLTFGAASVRIPDDHKIGHIELPSSWKLFGINLSSAPDEHEHFVIKRVVTLSDGDFDQVVKAKAANTALVFIHGFNTTFEDALYRNAQIVWDLQYKGLSVLFTWASRGDVTDYIYDKDSAYLARDSFISLLVKLKRDFGIEQVNVIAHSMGNLTAVDALANYARTSNPAQIARLVMAAPDVDRDQFVALAPVAKAIVGGMTLYASSTDRAMALSRTLAGGVPRAGDVPTDGPVILPSIETIDVSAIGTDIFGLNHNVFAGSRDVIEDISSMLKSGLPSPRLVQIRGVPEPPAAAQYWRYVP